MTHERARTLARIEQTLAIEPENAAALAYGAGALCALGERERSLEWAERAVLIDPDDNRVCYNAACTLVALGEVERPLGLIESASSDAGAMALHWARMDPELDAIRGDARFGAMLERAAARLAMKEPAGTA